MGNLQDKNIKEYLFLTGFCIFLSKLALGNTTILEFFNVNSLSANFFYILGFSFIAIKIILFDRYSLKNIIIILILSIFFIINYRETGSSEIIILFYLILGSKSVSLRKIVKSHFYTYSLIMLFALLLSLIGYTENFRVFSENGIRFSLGNTYPTDFAAGIFYLILDFVYLKNKKMNLFTQLIVLSIIFITFFATKATTSFILSFLFINYVFFMDHYKSKLNKKRRFKNFVAIIMYPFLCLISFIVPIFADTSSNIWGTIDKILSYRISYSRLAYERYGIPLFGNPIKFVGGGWNTTSGQEYFYVDNGYFYFSLFYGIIILSLVCIAFSFVIFNQQKNKYLIIILVMISLNALIEPRFLNYLYNPFLFSIPYYVLFKNTLKKAENKCE